MILRVFGVPKKRSVSHKFNNFLLVVVHVSSTRHTHKKNEQCSKSWHAMPRHDCVTPSMECASLRLTLHRRHTTCSTQHVGTQRATRFDCAHPQDRFGTRHQYTTRLNNTLWIPLILNHCVQFSLARARCAVCYVASAIYRGSA